MEQGESQIGAPTQSGSQQPDTDAMGRDKRRPVVGGTYGPTVAQQLRVYGTFFAVTAALVIGFILLANELDKPPESNPAVAPWAPPADPAEPIGIDQSPP